MPPTFFTTSDGDIILHASTDSGPKHDFRAHKFILSLASPVFKDIFTLPQPSGQKQDGESDIHTVDIPDSPKVIDIILRFIYPGVEPPNITNLSTLTALFSATDKYNIASMLPILRQSLKTFLPGDSFEVYIIACRFGLSEEAKEAAQVSTSWSMIKRDYNKAVRHISGPDLYRFARFVQEREREGLSRIERSLGWHLSVEADCNHWRDAEDFYSRLTKEVSDVFVRNPRLEVKDLFEVFDKIRDPPPGCELPENSAEWYYDAGSDEPFLCPLLPMSIRKNLTVLVRELNALNHTLLDTVFKKGVESS